MFRGSTKLFTDFIDTNYLLKQNSEGAKRLLAKLRLNSFYGKWATNPVHYVIEPYLDDGGILCFKSINKIVDEPIYTINASLTTAYSRYDLYINIQNNYDNFGAPNEVKKQINLDNFKIGETFEGKLRPVRVKGGIILVDTTFTFKDR